MIKPPVLKIREYTYDDYLFEKSIMQVTPINYIQCDPVDAEPNDFLCVFSLDNINDFKQQFKRYIKTAEPGLCFGDSLNSFIKETNDSTYNDMIHYYHKSDNDVIKLSYLMLKYEMKYGLHKRNRINIVRDSITGYIESDKPVSEFHYALINDLFKQYMQAEIELLTKELEETHKLYRKIDYRTERPYITDVTGYITSLTKRPNKNCYYDKRKPVKCKITEIDDSDDPLNELYCHLFFHLNNEADCSIDICTELLRNDNRFHLIDYCPDVSTYLESVTACNNILIGYLAERIRSIKNR